MAEPLKSSWLTKIFNNPTSISGEGKDLPKKESKINSSYSTINTDTQTTIDLSNQPVQQDQTYQNANPPETLKKVDSGGLRSRVEGLCDAFQAQAEKAQKAAIMARNMSHNLGSHVMAYLKQQMQSSIEIVKSKDHVLYDLNIDDNQYCFEQGKTELPFLVGMGYFINYLQERQDYIATVATSYIPYPTPIDFKDAIVDGINPDLKWKRHKTYGQKPFNILLNYIAKSEGYTRENVELECVNNGHYLRINYINYDISKNTPQIITGFKKGDLNELKGVNAVQLGVPGGTIGRQAVFSIIENITRNAAKHEKNVGNILNINLGLLDGAFLKDYLVKGWITKEMYENYIDCNDLSALYLLCVSYNTSISEQKPKEELLSLLWKGINEPYVKRPARDFNNEDIEISDYEFLSTNKGIKEIRISASWLRGNLNEDEYKKCKIDSKNDNKLSPLVYVDIHPVEEKHINSICYYIGLRKPYKAIIVKDQNSEDSSLNIFDTINPDSIKTIELDKWRTEGVNCCYDFVVAQNKDVYHSIRKTSSNRIVIWEELMNKYKYVLENNSLSEIQLINLLYAYHTGVDYSEDTIDTVRIQPILHIFDKDTNNNKEDYHRVHVQISDCSVSSDSQYIYRTHHESQAADFIKFNIQTNELFKNVRIEGVTGSNSTVRQIRYAPKHDFKWYSSHLYALRRNVAIIDERLFDAINGSVSESTHSEIKFIEEILKKEDELGNILERIYDNNGELFEKIKNYKTKEQFVQYVDTLQNIDLITNDYVQKSAIYSEKGVFLFNVYQYKDVMSFVCFIPNLEINKCMFTEVARIYKNGTIVRNETLDFQKLLLSNNSSMIFDIVSIHQGILDKIYRFVNCNKEDKELKCKITSQINCIFGNEQSILTIHSGRSKPTDTDMPQELPFIQYSALENAVFDSKYTLIELFDNARYENNNNN